MAILKKFSIAMLAGGLAVGVLAPGSIANAEVGAVVHTTEDPDAVMSDPPVDPTADPSGDPNGDVADPKGNPTDDDGTEQPAETTDPEPATGDEVPAIPAAPNAADPNGDDLEPEGLDAKVGAAALNGMPVAAASSLASGFRAGYIISDAKFYNGNSMSAAGIQTFLDEKLAGRCTIGSPGRVAGTAAYDEKGKYLGIVADKCLNEKRFTSASINADAYCGAYQGSQTSESAATIIARVARSCGISAQVLLVRLQLEQSLVSDTWPTVRQYDYATGSDCPDTGPGGTANCNPAFKGFAKQVYRGAWHLKRYKAANGLNYHPGLNWIQYHPNTSCGGSQVYIQNVATASLYTYTPYRPNDAALNAGWGKGDDCSSYGNRNFYQYYKQWFGSPTTFFADIPESYQFFKEVEWMGTSGLSTGFRMDDGRGAIYQPSAPISREAMAAFLYRLKKAKFTPPATSPFADVNPGDSFYREITWMYAMGYSTGTKQPSGKPLYSPKDPVSRSAMAAFLYRFKGASYVAPAASPFADMKPSDKFYREITWMYAVKYSTGNKQPAGKPVYLPRDNVSRGAMAAFIYRMEH